MTTNNQTDQALNNLELKQFHKLSSLIDELFQSTQILQLVTFYDMQEYNAVMDIHDTVKGKG